jgi:hypothetical protein
MTQPRPTGTQLVDQYNSLVDTACGLGIEGFRPVTRFSSTDVGLRRCAALDALIQARAKVDPGPGSGGVPHPTNEETEMARAKSKRKTAGSRATNGRPRGRPVIEGEDSVRGLTDAFNALVPEAKRKGIKWARLHSSMFGSKEAGRRQLERLRAAISQAA